MSWRTSLAVGLLGGSGSSGDSDRIPFESGGPGLGTGTATTIWFRRVEIVK